MKVGPKPNDWCPYKRKEREVEVQTHGETQRERPREVRQRCE